MMVEETGGMDLHFLQGFLQGATEGMCESGNYRFLGCTAFLGQREGLRCTHALEPWHTGIRMQVRRGRQMPGVHVPVQLPCGMPRPCPPP